MNIQTLTSEVLAGDAPAGLPDVTMLTRMASEFFSALPTGLPAPVNVLPGGTSSGPLLQGPQLPGVIAPGANVMPQTPQSVAAMGASTPSLVPHSTAPNGLPDNVAVISPALDNRFGAQALGVPTVTSSPQDVSSYSPFYFLSEKQAFKPNPVSDRISAQSFGLPGSEDLRALLQKDDRKVYPHSVEASSISNHYYFVDSVREHKPAFDVHAIRKDFPILQERVNGKPLVWFDNAATTQKPQCVIDRISYFYEHENSNIHRAAHELAARATDAYEAAREKVRTFLGATSVEEVIFVRGATEAINLVAKTWGAKNVHAGDEIIVSHLEHHANIVPWQQLAQEKGAKLRVIPVDDTGQVLLEDYKKLLNSRTKIVAVTQVSNALGTVVPVREIVQMAHLAGAITLVDGAQSVSHMRVNVQDIGADFFVFSGHKVFGPTGIGVVYGKRALLDEMPPWQGGGNMIADVTFERTVFQPPPNKFEAGTGNIADAVGLGAAIDYVQCIGLENIARYEHDLLAYATSKLQPISGVRLVGTALNKASVLSFILKGYTTEEVGKALNREGIAVRSGHHCAQPILRRFGLEATVRPSLAFYNTCEEVDKMVSVVNQLAKSRT